MPQGLVLATYDAVLFDVDGTLVDSLETIVLGLGDTYEHFTGNRPPSERILENIGRPLPYHFGLHGARNTDEDLRRMTAFAIKRFEVHAARERIFGPAVQALRLASDRGVRTALVTSKTAIELDQFMSRFSGAPWVDVTVCASDVERPKPDPQSALRACELLGVEPNRAAMIGDSVFDIQCAKRAGVTPIAVTYGAGRAEALAAAEPERLLATPEDLLAWAQSAFPEQPCPERRPTPPLPPHRMPQN